MKIGVVGLGKLGLPLATLFSKHFNVYGVDISKQRLLQIKNQETFFEPQVNEYLQKYGNNLTVSTDCSILKNCGVVFIITQTPSLPSGKFDLQYVESALKQIHQANPKCLVVISSTINIGDIDKLKAIHERIAYNPEFIKQGSIINDFLNPKFVLIGACNQKDGELIKDIWHKFHNKTTYIIKPIESEITKLSLNVSFTLGITFANVIGEICELYLADSNTILNIIYHDRRNYKSGLGFMGPCFPRDTNCFKATNVESASKLANVINELNDYTMRRYLQKIKELGKKKVGILGIGYKPNIPYTYESQPLLMAQQLLNEGYEVHIYDPLAESNAKSTLKGNVYFHSSLKECVKESEVLFIGTMNYSKPIVDPWR